VSVLIVKPRALNKINVPSMKRELANTGISVARQVVKKETPLIQTSNNAINNVFTNFFDGNLYYGGCFERTR